MRRIVVLPILICLSLLLATAPILAEEIYGALVLEGWSSPQLRFFNHASGNLIDLGEMAPTAAGFGAILNLPNDRILVVVNGDDFQSGSGGSLWLARYEDIDNAILLGDNIPWTVHEFPDGLNPWAVEAVTVEATETTYIAVSFQQGDAVGIYTFDFETFELTELYMIPANGPQDIASLTWTGWDGAEFMVAEAGGGSGDQLLFCNTSGDSFHHGVGLNPQVVRTQRGEWGSYGDAVYTLCTGNYSDIPGSLVKLTRGDLGWSSGPADTLTVELSGAPTAMVTTTYYDGDYDVLYGLIGNEYAATVPHLWSFHAGLDAPQPVLSPDAGGWALSAGFGVPSPGGEIQGFYVGSAIANTIHFLRYYDSAPVGTVAQLDGPAAALTSYVVGLSSVEDPTSQTAVSFTLAPIYPNPFNAQATVQLTLDRPGDVSIQLVDVLGRVAATVQQGVLTPGSHRLTLDGGGLAAGRYFVVADVAGERLVRPVVYVK